MYFCIFCIFYEILRQAWKKKKKKLTLTTLARILMHVECVSLAQRIRNPALAGVSFRFRGSDSASFSNNTQLTLS